MIATMEADPTKAYNQDDPSSVATLRRVDATGFIRLHALRLKVAAKGAEEERWLVPVHHGIRHKK